jgi:hypothetical protein
MSSHFLYSTNPFMKKLIQEIYRGDSHYVWCGENFDAGTIGKYSANSLVAPSSNPADIYDDLRKAVQNNDKHCSKIKEQTASLSKLAIEWEKKGEISSQDKQDIIYMLKHQSINHWRPVLYVIPRHIIAKSRIQVVSMKNRASVGVEYIIKDLKRCEFDLIEF